VTVRAGKGRKEAAEADIIPITGDTAVEALRDWKAIAGDRTMVFCRVLKSGRLGADKPISGEAIRQICAAYGFAPHDARRTMITSLDESGTPLSVTQKIARHANVSTTLRYTKARQAKDLKDLVKIGY
jgi:integrase